MSTLFETAPTEPAPACEVVRLHPDGIFLREDAVGIWVERRRGSRSVAAVAYSRDELEQLRDRLDDFLGER